MPPTATITGPTHPLLARIRDGHRSRTEHAETSGKILAHHRTHATSDQSVYRIDGARSWKHIGTYEDEQHRLHSFPDHIAVTARTPIHDVADAITAIVQPGRLRGHQDRAEALRAAAEQAAPMVAVLLGVCVRAGMLDWDTDESVQAAAYRLAFDAGWRLLAEPNPVLPRPRDIFADVAGALNLVDRPAAEYAAAYLDDRDGINTALEERGIRWGGAMLGALRAADHARVAGSTWSAYVSRGQAPRTDDPGAWRRATVDAWRLTRTAPSQTAWW